MLIEGRPIATDVTAIDFARPADASGLPAMINGAAKRLANAVSHAEVLDAWHMAAFTYSTAKNLAHAKNAHDEVIRAARRAMADALAIESEAKCRLAGEYDAAQKRGEVAKRGRPVNVPGGNIIPTVGDIGLTRKEIFDARLVKDAERFEPGIVERWLDEMREVGDEPRRTALRKAIRTAAGKIRCENTVANNRERERQRLCVVADMPTIGARYRLIPNRDFRDLDDNDIPPGSIDAIVFDPPYAKAFLGSFAPLWERASLWLKEGGSLLCMLPGYYLPEIFKELGDQPHLNYYGEIHYIMGGQQAVKVWSRQTFSRAKSVLRYVKGKYADPQWVSDVVTVDSNDKEFHDHGQSVTGMAKLIEMCSVTGDTILDPMCGGGATGEAALRTNRRFIGSDIDENAIAVTTRRLKDVAENGLQDSNFDERQRKAAAMERLIGHLHRLCEDDDEWSQIAEAAEAAGHDVSWLRESVARR